MITERFPSLRSITWHTTSIGVRVITHKTKNSPILYTGYIRKAGKKNVLVQFDDGRAGSRAYKDVFYIKEVLKLIDDGNVPAIIILEIEKEKK